MARRALSPGQVPTGQLVIETASRRFGEVGFDGLSLRDLGGELGVTAPTLLHHVGSKQKLYARVLAHVAASLTDAIRSRTDKVDVADDAAQVIAFVDAYLAWSRANEAYARLLMRELLDNRERAARSKYWPLAPLVTLITERVQRLRRTTRVDAAMTVFQTIGAIAYFAAAEPTLRQVLGISGDIDDAFAAAMHRALHLNLDETRRDDGARSDSRTRLRGAGQRPRGGRARGPARRAAAASPRARSRA